MSDDTQKPQDPKNSKNPQQPIPDEGAQGNTQAENDIELLKSQLASMTETCRRALADLSNYKRFVEEQRKQAAWYGTAEILKDLLPIIDNFDRALQHMSELEPQHREGVEAIARQLKAVLQKNRVETIETVGKPFDANMHEVLSAAPGPDGIVVEEFEKGYLIAGQVLRPAKVIVGNGQ